jgi:2-polyprenyl-3-methyl-5-hydroxy-6-metoxy-1,4-benzoquinol methylase
VIGKGFSMFKQAREIMKKYKQYKTADQYTDNLGALHTAMYPHIPSASIVLDIGSAYAVLPLMLSLRGDTVTASDMTRTFTSMPMLKDNNISWLDLNIEKDKSILGKYDLITFTEVLEHLNSNPLSTIKKIYESLEIGGYVVCTTPAKEIHGTTVYMNDGAKPGLWNDLESWRDIPEYKGKWKDQHTFHYDQFELVSLFTEAGFEVEDVFVIAEFSHMLIGRKL